MSGVARTIHYRCHTIQTFVFLIWALSILWSADLSFNMAQFATDSSELLDFLFDQSNGILTHDKYMTNGFIENQQFSEHFKPMDLGLSDCEADELLNCLNEVDLLDGFTPTDCIEPFNMVTSNTECSLTVTSHCHEDHIYSRSPDDYIHSSSSMSPNAQLGSPSTGSALSSYSYSDGGSPNTLGLQDDCYSTSSLSSGLDCQLSPLGGNMEEISLAANGSYNSTIFVLQSTELIESVSNNGIDSMVDSSGLVSLDIIETDVESYSDDGSTGAELDSVNDNSLYDESAFYSSTGSGLPFTLHDLDARSRKKSQSSKLILSDEEKLLLAREGISIPTDVPLTKEEERALKSVRRKIRNKVSAKVSRKRKQEYVDGLEKRVKICTQQNRQLQQKVEKLEKMNQSFMMQMKKLQAMLSVSSGVTVRHAQTGTCIMVLVMSFAFFILPNVGPWLGPGQPSIPHSEKTVGPGRSRSLLTNNADNMLFSAQPDYTDDETDPDSDGSYDSAAPNFTPAVSNPYLTSLQKAVSQADVISSSTGEQNHPVNASAVIDSLGDSTGLSRLQDATLKADDGDGEVSESVVDMSKFPAKNDL